VLYWQNLHRIDQSRCYQHYLLNRSFSSFYQTGLCQEGLVGSVKNRDQGYHTGDWQWPLETLHGNFSSYLGRIWFRPPPPRPISTVDPELQSFWPSFAGKRRQSPRLPSPSVEAVSHKEDVYRSNIWGNNLGLARHLINRRQQKNQSSRDHQMHGQTSSQIRRDHGLQDDSSRTHPPRPRRVLRRP
jgi:hypothetical protein